MCFQVPGDPHPWPKHRKTDSRACAILVVDMQEDYCSPGYYMDQAGYDVERLREPIERIQRVLTAARRSGMLVIYTRQARALDSSPSDAVKDPTTSPFPQTAAYGESGWHIIPELLPQPHETVIEKTTCNAFVSGELDRLLREHGIRHLAFCGNTIDVCVHSTLRAAVDLGYECLLLADGCGAVNEGLHTWAIESVKVENGVFGTVAQAESFIAALT